MKRNFWLAIFSMCFWACSSTEIDIPAGCLATQCVTAFRMDVQEVSQQEFLQIMGTNPSQNQECGLNCPVENVQENQAQEYCHKVGKRLPTALEWQYAAKSGQVEGHPWGREIGDYVWFSENSQGQVHPVGENLPNAWGLVDMAGNVAEWTSTPASGPNSALRIVMGGHANSTQDDLAESLLLKQTYLSEDRGALLGFRCVRSLP